MKRIALMSISLGLVMLFGGSLTSHARIEKPRREKAVVEFAETVKFNGVLMRGEYIIVHDEELMAKGEACSYVYRSKNGQEGELVTSFHCVHADRGIAKRFTMRILKRTGPYELAEVQEFQFAGSAAGHRVPGL